MEPPLRAGSRLGLCAIPRGRPGRRLGGLKLCLVQCVCACRGGDPCPRGSQGGGRGRVSLLPRCSFSPFQVWGGPKGVSLHVHNCSWCLAGVRVAASPPSWGLYFVCVSVCLCQSHTHPAVCGGPSGCVAQDPCQYPLLSLLATVQQER